MKLSLGKKIIILLIMFAVLLISVSIVVSNIAFRDMNDDQFRERADELAATTAQVVDKGLVRELRDAVLNIYNSVDNKVGSEEWGSPEFDEYVEKYSSIEETDAFQTLMQTLRNIQAVNSVNCLYISYVVPEDEAFLYLIDAAEEDPCPPGCFDPIYEMNQKVLTDPTVGFPAYITNTEEYGWLVSAGSPVYDEGEVVGYTFVDISMDDIRARQQSFLMQLAMGMLILTIILCIIAIIYVHRSIVRPVNLLTKAAAHYGSNTDHKQSEFESLEIHTGDEIETLLQSMIQMEKDIGTYIDNLIETRTQLSSTQQRAEYMDILAHQDALTGVGNKMAYDKETIRLNKEIEEGTANFGVVMIDLNDLKKANDTYGHDAGDEKLKKLADMICRTFAQSPVFRIGGDEFVVTLQGVDYENADRLLMVLEQEMEEEKKDLHIEEWMRISAAVGYARYESGVDKSLDDVFFRADQEMYHRKQTMKKVALIHNT